MITVRCNKTLINDLKEVSFIKGNTYTQVNGAKYSTLNESTQFLDEQNEPHSLGIWLKHFKQI